ncbi:MAG: HTH-type transcriptional activator IlvY [Desulfotignum sp.]|nr:HTH-type transcriptional activator IlvY [Desulfotignum sp.]
MDIRTLKLFCHLARTLHFAGTSQACHITPSALTRLIQRLEAEVGEPLFIRDNRLVELSHAGKIFKAYADDVIHRWEELQAQLSQDVELRGELSLFCSVTAAYSILPELVRQYRKMHPKVQIRLETGDAARALSKLANREADAVIAAVPGNLEKHLCFQQLAVSPLVFIMARQFPDILVMHKGSIDWEKTPLIIADTGLSRDHLDRWFAQNHIKPQIYSQVSGHEAIIALVNLGCGIGLVPGLVLEKSLFANQITIVSDTPKLPDFVIGLCTRHKQLSNPRIRALWSLAQNAPSSACTA